MATIFVGQLPFNNFFDKDLRDIFEPYGVVRSTRVNVKNGEGFVVFEHTRHADAAIQALHGKRVMQGRRHPIQVMYSNSSTSWSWFGMQHNLQLHRHCGSLRLPPFFNATPPLSPSQWPNDETSEANAPLPCDTLPHATTRSTSTSSVTITATTSTNTTTTGTNLATDSTSSASASSKSNDSPNPRPQGGTPRHASLSSRGGKRARDAPPPETKERDAEEPVMQPALPTKERRRRVAKKMRVEDEENIELDTHEPTEDGSVSSPHAQLPVLPSHSSVAITRPCKSAKPRRTAKRVTLQPPVLTDHPAASVAGGRCGGCVAPSLAPVQPPQPGLSQPAPSHAPLLAADVSQHSAQPALTATVGASKRYPFAHMFVPPPHHHHVFKPPEAAHGATETSAANLAARLPPTSSGGVKGMPFTHHSPPPGYGITQGSTSSLYSPASPQVSPLSLTTPTSGVSNDANHVAVLGRQPVLPLAPTDTTMSERGRSVTRGQRGRSRRR